MFPNKTRWLKRPIGWEDLGETEKTFYRRVSFGTVNKYQGHNFCNTQLRIGKENNEIFKYCPLCMVKL